MKHLRKWIQWAAAALFNGYALGFSKGTIFRGRLKMMCVPVLNCYSCPGALGACPIGALQAVLGDRKYKFSFYILGMLMLFGIVGGRIICGFLCPFGLIQELLHKIRTPKLRVKPSVDRPLRWLKYLVLLVFVLLLPLLLTDRLGIGSPYFCKLICPAGTLEGGIPLLLSNPSLRSAAGFLFSWKMGILVGILLLSIFIYRPFCKYLCPLGAFYGLFNRFSFFQLHIDQERCTGCGACERACKMDVHVQQNINSTECIRCGECRAACPHQAIGVRPRKQPKP